MHNLTYTERARIAYAAGNDELAEALEQLAEYERVTENLDNLNADMLEVLTDMVFQTEELVQSEWSREADEFVPAIVQARAVIKQVEES